MTVWGELRARFYNGSLQRLYDNAGVLNTSGTGIGYVSPMRARSKEYFKRVGWGAIYLPPEEYGANYPLIQPDHICMAFVFNSVVSDYMVVCEPFTIEVVRIVVEDEIPMLEVSGPTIIDELAQQITFSPIGAREQVNTTTTVNKGAGETELEVADATDMETGDDIAIRSATKTEPGYPWITVDYRGQLTDDPSFGTGLGGADQIQIDPPLPVALPMNSSVVVSDYRNPTTSDVSQILARGTAPSWSLTVEGGGSGTTAGTSHAPNGHSILALLNDTAAMTGEWWRLNARATARDAPSRTLEWRKTSDSSGLELVMPTQADASARFTNSSYGIIENFVRQRSDVRLSHIVPYGGGGAEDAITLLDATDSPSTGFTQTDYERYGYASLQNDAVDTAISPRERWEVVTFGNIRPDGSSVAARQQAANALLAAAENYLTAREERLRYYHVQCVLHVNLEIGQTVDFTWSDDYLDLSRTGANALYITEINREMGADGVLRHYLTLSEALVPAMDGPIMVANQIAEATSNARGISAVAIGSSPITIPGNNHAPVYVSSSVPTGGLSVNSNQGLTLNVPGGQPPSTSSALTTNSTASSVHTHNIEGTSDASVTASQLLESDANGALRVQRLGVGASKPGTDGQITAAGELTITSGGADITGQVDIAGDLIFVTGYKIGSGGTLSIEPDAQLQLSPATSLQLTPVAGNIVINAGTGQLRVQSDLRFMQASQILTTSGDLTLAPASGLALTPTSGDITLVPGSEVVQVGSGAVDPLVKTDHWVSGFLGSGWGLSHDGHLDTRSIYTDELFATYFTVEHSRVKSGGEWITPSVSQLTADMTVPAVSSSTTISVEDVPGLPGVPVFSDNDYVMLRVFDIGTGIAIYNIWGQVDTYSDNSDGTQDWTFTTRSAAVTGDTISQGSVVIDFGQSGDGWIWLNALDQAGAPYIDFGRWHTNPYTASNREHPIRLGDLGGITGDKGLMGLFIGDPAGRRFIASEEGLEARGMDFVLYSETAATGYIRVNAIEVNLTHGGGTETLRPNADVTAGTDAQGKAWTDNIEYSTGTTGEALIDDDPDSVDTGDYIQNVAGESAVATFDLSNIGLTYSALEQVEIKAHVTIGGNYTNMRLVAQIQDNSSPDYNAHTVPVELANQDTSTGLVTVYVHPLEDMSETDWNGARLRLHWYCVPNTLGSDPKLRIGPDAGIEIEASASFAAGDDRNITWYEEWGGEYAAELAQVTSGSTNELQIRVNKNTEGDLGPAIYMRASDTATGTNRIQGFADELIEFYTVTTGDGGPFLSMAYDDVTFGQSVRIGVDNSEYLLLSGGVLEVGNPSSAPIGLEGFEYLDLNQAAADDEIVLMKSSDVAHGISVGTNVTTATYCSFSKWSATGGGLVIRGLAESSEGVGVSMAGLVAGDGNNARSTSAYGAATISGYSGTTPATMGASYNAVVLRSGNTARWIMGGDGAVYMDSTDSENNFDEFNDLELVRAAQVAMGGEGIIQSEWDRFVTYNRDDLNRLNIVNEHGFIHQQNMTKLLCGALWQAHTRIAALEQQIRGRE